MKSSRYTPEQAAFGLRQAEEGTPVSEVCRKMGISEETLYRWKKKFQGMGVAEVRRLRVLPRSLCSGVYVASNRDMVAYLRLPRQLFNIPSFQ